MPLDEVVLQAKALGLANGRSGKQKQNYNVYCNCRVGLFINMLMWMQTVVCRQRFGQYYCCLSESTKDWLWLRQSKLLHQADKNNSLPLSWCLLYVPLIVFGFDMLLWLLRLRNGLKAEFLNNVYNHRCFDKLRSCILVAIISSYIYHFYAAFIIIICALIYLISSGRRKQWRRRSQRISTKGSWPSAWTIYPTRDWPPHFT